MGADETEREQEGATAAHNVSSQNTECVDEVTAGNVTGPLSRTVDEEGEESAAIYEVIRGEEEMRREL
jgi:hypothetical protein